MGSCPKCLETFTCKEDFYDHMIYHQVDPWRIKQLLSEWELRIQPSGPHGPSDPCVCRMYGLRFECERRKHG